MGKYVQEVQIRAASASRFATISGAERVDALKRTAADLGARLAGRVVWNVNTTAAGGGVAEMLHTLLAYGRGLGIDTRWLVISGDNPFFRVTKRLHNALHGEAGDGSALGPEAREIYDAVIRRNAKEMVEMVRPGDVVILHDPQTAGLIPVLSGLGVTVIWRCHIGADKRTLEGDRAWSFLAPYLNCANAFVFSRFSYVPDYCDHGRTVIVAPSVDPFSPKSQDLEPATIRAILSHIGLVAGPVGEAGRTFTRDDGSVARVERKAEVLREGPAPAVDTPLVVQVSRWDRLKDPLGVLEGFCKAAKDGPAAKAKLMLVGPSVAEVADDPEGLDVYNEVCAYWKKLPEEMRRKVDLVTLPMDDLQENAVMVNALQRHAAIVVQKSLREGFGLTVTEAMWKARPVVASAVGGIQDQIEHGVSGMLLKDPSDLDAFAAVIRQLLGNPDLGERLGRNARQRVRQQYLGIRSLMQFADLIERLDIQTRGEVRPGRVSRKAMR